MRAVQALHLHEISIPSRRIHPAPLRPAGRQKQFTKLEARLKRKGGGSLSVEISRRPVRHDSGKVLYFEVIAEDASHVRVEQRLRHVKKMEAIGRLAGGIAHDFNNVLAVIVACSEMLAEKLAFLSKPFSPNALAGKIRSILDG